MSLRHEVEIILLALLPVFLHFWRLRGVGVPHFRPYESASDCLDNSALLDNLLLIVHTGPGPVILLRDSCHIDIR